MVSNLPLITIGITCFNAESTIEEALESALSQTYSNIEIIIVDDVSFDESISKIESYISAHKHVNLIQHEANKGVAGARNTIIHNAQGEYIAFFDDDDISDPQRVEIQYKRLSSYEEENKASVVGCWVSGYKLYDNGYRHYFDAIGSKENVPVGRDMIEYHLLLPRKDDVFYGSGTPSCSFMMAKSTFEYVGCYDKAMRRLEDGDLTMRLALSGGHFIGCSEELLIQRASTGDDKNSSAGYESEIQLITKYKAEFENKRQFDFASKWIKLRYYHFSKQFFKKFLQLLQLSLMHPFSTLRQFVLVVPSRLRHEQSMSKE